MARPKLGESESKRLQMVITEDELDAISEWQHLNRVSSRSEAIRRLCQIGLAYSREIGSTRDRARDAIQMALSGLDRLLKAGSWAQDERARDILGAMDDIQQSAKDMISLFQDMATTDSAATAMEDAGEFVEQLHKVKEAKSGIDARRKK